MSHHNNVSEQGFGTRAIHAGQEPDLISGAVVTPISLASTFAQSSPGLNKGFEYSRTGNPTRLALENNIAGVEGGKYGLAFASGSATLQTITALLDPGDHILCCDDAYGGTIRFFNKIAAKSLKINFVDMTDIENVKKAITPQTKMVWLETPTNPLLKISDIKAIAEITHQYNAFLVVDNTFMSPYFQKPLTFGTDIVMHSATKYLNGHSDVVLGVLVTNNQQLFEKLKFLQNAIGAVPAPFDCFLVLRGMKTLHLRMQAHEKNAIIVSQFLETHPKVIKVIYPGLKSHPQHELAKHQQSGFSGMITFYIKGGINESRKFLENLKLFALAESLGCVESLAEHPAIMTHASVAPEVRAKLGISDNLVRLSIGVEDIEDILNDLKYALDQVPIVN